MLADPRVLRASGLTLKDLIAAVAARTARPRAATCATARASSWCASRGYLQSADDIEKTVVEAPERHPHSGAQRRQGRRRVHARAEARSRGTRRSTRSKARFCLRRGENPRDVLDRGSRRRSSASTATCCPKGCVSCRSTIAPAGRHDAGRPWRTTWSKGAALVALVLWIFLRALSGLAGGRGDHAARALDGVRRPPFRGSAGQYVVDGGHRLRHLARRCGDPRRERLSARGGGAAVAGRSARRGGARDTEVVRPILFSLSIIVAAMMPIFTLERVEGRIFRPVALTYAFALGGALLFTLTCVPALTAVLLRRGKVNARRTEVSRGLRQSLPDGTAGRADVIPIPTCLTGVLILAVAIFLRPAPGHRVSPRDERGGHPHHRHHARRDVARAWRRGASRDALAVAASSPRCATCSPSRGTPKTAPTTRRPTKPRPS